MSANSKGALHEREATSEYLSMGWQGFGSVLGYFYADF